MLQDADDEEEDRDEASSLLLPLKTGSKTVDVHFHRGLLLTSHMLRNFSALNRLMVKVLRQ